MSFQDPALLAEAHKASVYNKGQIDRSTLCGCFHCKATFDASTIAKWEDRDHTTAMCPRCDIDAVIGDASGYPVNEPEFLAAMHSRWFKNRK